MWPYILEISWGILMPFLPSNIKKYLDMITLLRASRTQNNIMIIPAMTITQVDVLIIMVYLLLHFLNFRFTS